MKLADVGGVLTQFLSIGSNKKVELENPQTLNGQPIKVIEVGVAGTQIYGGYINEDYLSRLHGRHWMDEQDKMRRSDSQVRMMLSCIKSPIKSSNWTIKKLEDTPEAETQKILYEKAMFRDTGKSFKRTIGEILTCVDFGFSLMEVTHQAKFDDPDLGSYNTLKSLSWRSQRTIERWIVDREGVLQYVNQIAYGDEGKISNIDARFLVHFAPDMEGDNYEGISPLRFIYGNWLRKNHYLKLMASGIEKSAIPVPIAKIPSGKENSPEYDKLKSVLKAYTSNQMNYITIPAGWEIDTIEINFDVEKMKAALDFENMEMMNSCLASFLVLGQGKGSSGNRNLSENLSDFFKMSQQYLADHIIEQLNEKVFQRLLDMNFGPNTKRLVTLDCDGLTENADVAFSEIMKNLTDSGVVQPDEELEGFVREQYGFPVKDPSTSAEYKAAPKDNQAPQLAESRWQTKKIGKATLRRK